MKIVAVNGSPRGREGNTERLLEPFLTGAHAAGAQTETIYLNEKKIGHCRGCFACWVKTPGVCTQQDDMAELLGIVATANMIVYATPLYCFTVSGLLKNFMDRSIPLVTPAIEIQDGRYYHGQRQPKKRSAVLISNCGFPGNYNFDGLVKTFEVMLGGTLDGQILCAQGGVLQDEEAQPMLDSYFQAIEQAGREMVARGAIAPETQAVIDRDLFDPQIYQEHANQHWLEVLDQLNVRKDH